MMPAGERHADWGSRVRIVKVVGPIAFSLALIGLVTALLWHLRLTLSPQHVVFYYLLPTAAVAIFWGNRLAILTAIVGALCAAYFLYEPAFSLHIVSRLEIGEFICFTVLAALSSKCAADILRPAPGRPHAKAARRPLARETR